MKNVLLLMALLTTPLATYAGVSVDCGPWDENHHPDEYSLKMIKDFSSADGDWSLSIKNKKVDMKKHQAWTNKNEFHVLNVSEKTVTEYIFGHFTTIDGGNAKLKIYQYKKGKKRPLMTKKSLDCWASLMD